MVRPEFLVSPELVAFYRSRLGELLLVLLCFLQPALGVQAEGDPLLHDGVTKPKRITWSSPADSFEQERAASVALVEAASVERGRVYSLEQAAGRSAAQVTQLQKVSHTNGSPGHGSSDC